MPDEIETDRVKEAEFWARFNALQAEYRRWGNFLPHPKGVFRFKTFEELNAWDDARAAEGKRRPKLT